MFRMQKVNLQRLKATLQRRILTSSHSCFTIGVKTVVFSLTDNIQSLKVCLNTTTNSMVDGCGLLLWFYLLRDEEE